MRWAIFAVYILAPISVSAEVTQFVFTTSPQTVSSGVPSETITIEAQDGSGQPVSGSTVCIRLSSSSGGQFSTNTSWSDPLENLTLTLSSNQSRRNFYYKGSVSGTHTLTAQAAPRPDGGTCTQWSPASGVTWSATHAITIEGVETSGSTQANTQNSASSTPQTTSTNAVQLSTPVSSYVAPPEPTLFADAGGDRTAIVGADTEYVARAYNRKKESVENAGFRWNFGDGTTATGPSVLHHFEYPGRYVVVVSISQHYESVSDRFVVTAEPAKLGFFVESDGSVRIENKAGRDLDLSTWVVRAFFREFVLPEDSMVLQGASMRISSKALGFFAGPETELAYPNGVLALKADQASIEAVVPATIPTPTVAAETRTIAPVHTSAEREPVPEKQEESASAPVGTSSLPAAAASSMTGTYWWFGALALAGLTGATIVATRRMRSKEWDIVEETADSV